MILIVFVEIDCEIQNLGQCTTDTDAMDTDNVKSIKRKTLISLTHF